MRDGIREVVKTLFEAILLVVIVVVLFLQTWRASIIPLVAVPISIVGTFAVLLGFGFSINTLSLFGLVLAIGIVVDDAIVVVENVERNIEAGLSPRDASYKAMEEVSGPIIAIGLVLCAVFVPVAFLSGLTGEFYRQFALTIAFSTVISALNSLTLSPALSAILLKSREAPPDRLTRVLDRSLGWIFRPFNRVFKRGSQRYGTTVASIIRRGGVVARGVRRAASRSRSSASSKVPHGFVPTQDKQYLVAFAQLPDAATLDRTERVMREMADIGRKQPGVAERGAVPRAVDQRLRQRAERRHRVLHAQAVRRAPREGRVRPEHRRRAQRQVLGHPGRVRGRVPAAAGERARPGGRLQAAARGPRRARRDGAERRHPGADRAGVPDAGARRRVLRATGSTCPSSRSTWTARR